MNFKGQSTRELAKKFAEPGPTQDRPALPATGRAGRNLPAAITVGVSLGAVVALGIFVYPPLFSAVIVAAVFFGCRELAGAFAREGVRVALPPLWIGGIVTVFSAYISGLQLAAIMTFITVAAAAIWIAIRNRGQNLLRDIAASALIALYVPLLGSFAVAITVNQSSPLPVLTYILAVIGNDLGGWMAGVLFGKHPMAPSISPKKSWEGFAGSVALATLISVILFIFMPAPWWWGLIMGPIIAVVATAGDLAESLLKRDVGLKDMGWILPGHGGVMDRLDSLLMCAPVAYGIFWIAFGWVY